MFRLALSLGKTVEELTSTLTVNELNEWKLYESVEPFGEIREDWRIGFLLAVFLNTMRGKNKPPISIIDVAPGTVADWVNLLQSQDGGTKTLLHPNVAIFDQIFAANQGDPNVDDRTTEH